MNFRILIPVALIAIGAGLYGLSGNLLKKEQEPVEVTTAEDIHYMTVWKAASAIEMGHVVTRRDFVREKITEQEANQHGLDLESSVNFVEGMVAAQPILPDQWITQDDFATPDQPEYIDLTIAKNKVPYGIKVNSDTMIGGVITHGTIVDIVALSSITQNLASTDNVKPIQTIYYSPLLMAIKVLKVEEKTLDKGTEIRLILELTRKELATLIIAKKISQIEVHKSAGIEQAEFLNANSGDVLPTYQAIKEYRAESKNVN